MFSLSVCMIVKNEEKNICKCLQCVKKIADEIIVVDTGSLDNTKQIARQFTDNVYDFVWHDDFSAARNYSFSKAKCDYIMWIDADDIILQKDIDKINKLKKRRLDADVYMLKYVASFDENYNEIFAYYRERIVKNNQNFVWQDPIHEVILPRGKIRYLDISIFHDKKNLIESKRNLKIYQNLIEKNQILSARQKFYYARELMYNRNYDEAIKQFSLFLLEQNGWVQNKIEACLDLSKCYIVKEEMQNALTALFGSFAYGVPRGEVLYEIGNIFLQQNKLDQAIYWYKLALSSKADLKSGAFVLKDCYDFLPALQLCVCYYKKGDDKNAFKYHKMAQKIYPSDPSVKNNENYFNSLNLIKSNKKVD